MNKDTHNIYFTQKDERILKLIAKYMDADYVLMPMGPIKKNPTIVINSKEIKNDLLNIGITSNKSTTLKMQFVPTQYLPSFIRGVIDGDGYTDPNGYYLNITTASVEFAEKLLQIFINWGLNVLKREHFTQKAKPVYIVKVTGKQDLIKLSNIL